MKMKIAYSQLKIIYVKVFNLKVFFYNSDKKTQKYSDYKTGRAAEIWLMNLTCIWGCQ